MPAIIRIQLQEGEDRVEVEVTQDETGVAVSQAKKAAKDIVAWMREEAES